MKALLKSNDQMRTSLDVFSQFNAQAILSLREMTHVKGGTIDGGENEIILPSTPKP